MTELVTLDFEELMKQPITSEEDKEPLKRYLEELNVEIETLRNSPFALNHDVVITENQNYGHLSLTFAFMDREKGRVLTQYFSKETVKQLIAYLQQYLRAAELVLQRKEINRKLHPYRGY